MSQQTPGFKIKWVGYNRDYAATKEVLLFDSTRTTTRRLYSNELAENKFWAFEKMSTT